MAKNLRGLNMLTKQWGTDMKTIEDKIQEILAEHHECRWMDSSELENCLRMIATEQKAIDDAEHTEEMRKLNDEWKENLEIQRKMLIEKACKWLKSKADECFVSGDSVGEHLVFKDLSLAEFLKAMEK